MATEKLANDAVTALDGGIDDSTTSIVVADGSVFPSTGNFRVKISGTEILLITARTGNTLTSATRGSNDDQTPVAHDDGDIVVLVLTKDALNKLFVEENNQQGAIGSLPSAEKAGRDYNTTDALYRYRDNGAAWDAYGPIWALTPPPAVADYTWDNQDSATAIDNKEMIYFSKSLAANVGNGICGKYKSAPSTPYVITALIIPDIQNQNYHAYGLFFRENSSGKIVALHSGWANGKQSLFVRKYTTSTNFSADYTSLAQEFTPWLRIADDGTDRIVSVSHDGINWKEIHSVGRTDFLTADQVGFFMNPESVSGNNVVVNAITIASWLEA